MYTVYLHTSPSRKRYVGITCQKPKHRWQNGLGYCYNEYFTNAIKKYGWDNIKHEILFENLTKEEAKRKLSKQIICLETGTCYSSLTLASKTLNINIGNISQACRGAYKTAGGYHFKYAN